ALFGVAFGLLQRSWPQVAVGLAIGFLGLFWAVARSVQEEDRDAELRASWPYRLPTPLGIPPLRPRGRRLPAAVGPLHQAAHPAAAGIGGMDAGRDRGRGAHPAGAVPAP